MVDNPVNDRHRHVVVVEELAPAGEVLVGGQDDGPVFVQAVDQLEQVVPGLPGHGQVANTQVVARGGTVTHHHAVGRDHRGGYEKQMPPLFLTALGAAKESMDPQGVLNPGVLIDPVGKSVGITGAMQDYPVKE